MAVVASRMVERSIAIGIVISVSVLSSGFLDVRVAYTYAGLSSEPER